MVRSDRTLFSVAGRDRERFLQGMISNDLHALSQGKAMVASMLTPKGKLIAFFTVCLAGSDYQLEVDRTQGDKVRPTLEQYVIAEDVTITDLSREITVFSVLGAGASEAISSAGGVDFQRVEFGFPVEPTWQVYVPSSRCGAFEQKLHLSAHELSPNEFETLRIEAGIPRFGVDVSDENLPLEIPYLERGVSYTKGCYIGQETMARVHSRGGHVAKRLMGLAVAGVSRPLPVGSTVQWNGKEVGKITSSCLSSALGSPLSLAMIHREAFSPGTAVEVESGGQRFSASVITLPL
jgi:folate-binding protein YgfZ